MFVEILYISIPTLIIFSIHFALLSATSKQQNKKVNMVIESTSCNSLTSINIPKGVNSIGTKSFSQCNKLKSIYINSDDINIGAFLCGTDNTFVTLYGNKTQQ